MYDSTLILALALVTLVAALGFGFWQRSKVEKAKKEQHHSAATEGRPDLRKNEDRPGAKSQ